MAQLILCLEFVYAYNRWQPLQLSMQKLPTFGRWDLLGSDLDMAEVYHWHYSYGDEMSPGGAGYQPKRQIANVCLHTSEAEAQEGWTLSLPISFFNWD